MSAQSSPWPDWDRHEAISVLFGRGRRLRMFISSVMRDGELAAERQAVAARLDDLDGFEPWMWERNGVAGTRDARDFCLYSAQSSDALIMIIGSSLSPVTRDEFEIARVEGVPRFVFLKQGVERDADTDSFVEMIRCEHHVTADFESPQDLAEKVVEAIGHHHIESWRFRFLAEKRGVDFTGPAPEFAVGPGRADDDVPGVVNGSDDLADVLAAVDDLDPLQRTLTASHLVQESVTLGFAGVLEELLGRVDVDVEGLTDEDRGWALNALALADHVFGRTDEAEQRLREMKRLGQDACDDRLVATALQNLGVVAFEASPATARDLFEQAEEVARSYSDEYQIVQLQLSRINAATSEGDLAEATRLLDEVEPTVRSWGGHLLAAVNGTRGLIASQRGNYQRAEQLFHRTLRSARRRRHPRDAILGWQNLAAAAWDDGRPRTAADRLERAVSIAETLGWPGKLGELHWGLGAALFEVGDFDDAASHLARSGDYYRQVDATIEAARCDADLGAALAAANKMDQAKIRLEQALGPLVAAGDVEWEARVLANLSAIAKIDGEDLLALSRLRRAIAAVGDESPSFASDLLLEAAVIAVPLLSTRDEAVEFLQRWIDLADRHRSPREAALRALDAAVRVARFDVAQAEDLLRDAQERAEALDDSPLLFDVYTDLGVALVEAGKLDRARELLEAAHQIASDIDDPGRLRQALFNLGESARRSGEFEQAEILIREVVGLAEESGNVLELLEARAELATILQDQERWGEARSEFESVVRSPSSTALLRARGWLGLGNTAFLTGAFSTAISHYDRARALYRSSFPEDYVGILGAMLESRIARGETRIDEHVQRLVDRAQELRCSQVGSDSLARCGNRSLIQGRRDQAIGLYAVACLLAMDAHRGDPEYLMLGTSQALIIMIVGVHDYAPDEVDHTLNAVIDRLVDDYDLPRGPLQSVAELARDTMAELLAS